MTQINVVYHFRLKNGTTPAQFLAANQPIAELIQAQPGFYYRSVAQCDDGSWLDSVFWENAESARNAMTAFDGSVHAPAFIATIDESSLMRLEGGIAQSSMDE